MFNQRKPNPVREKPKVDDCEIEVKNTNKGKKIRFRGKCSKEQVSAFAQQNGIDLE